MSRITILSSPEILAFRQSQTLTTDLQRLLADPTLRRAFDAVRLAATPGTLPEQRPGVPFDSSIAHLFNQQLGVHKALATLEAMCFPKNMAPVEQFDPMDEPYASSVAEEYRSPTPPKI